MPRVQLTPLSAYPFSFELPVRVTDLNHADHLAAYALVGMLDEAWVRFLAHLKLGEPGLGEPGLGSINAELVVNYLGEGKLHDGLTIAVGVREISSKSFRLHFLVSRDEQKIALAEIGVVCFDYVAKKAAPLPAVFLSALNNL